MAKSRDAAKSPARMASGDRLPFERFYPYLFVVLISLWAADLVILSLRDHMLPTQAPEARPRPPSRSTSPSAGNYQSIVSKNVFSSDGVISDPIGAEGQDTQEDSAPVLSQLPLELVGTIVHVTPEKSIASVNLKNRNMIVAVKKDDDMEGLGRVISVDRTRLVFRNLNNNRLEYIEMNLEENLNFGMSAPPTAPVRSGGGVRAESETDFRVSRSTINSKLSNFSEVLQEARAEPVVGPDGSVEGFRLMDIKPDSIFVQLGLRRGDIIKSVDGTMIDSPAKAMQMYNSLKNAPQVTLDIERGGRTLNLNYTIE